MMSAYFQTVELTVLHEPFMRGLGEIRIAHPAGTFATTPASLISLEAIANNQHLLAGVGLDWGSGAGCLAIAAARIPAVRRVIGLELSAADVTVARQNAAANSVERKTTFFESDSYSPIAAADRREFESLAGRIDFVVANPPASDGDDGFGWRRRVLAGARQYLTPSGRVFLSVSSQYGMRRVMGLLDDVSGFKYGGILASTEWVPFDLARPDLLECLRLYAQEESRGGLSYDFHDPAASGEQTRTATSALRRYEQSGESPLMKWQTHLFERLSDRDLQRT
jgi:16S rRNA G966 N2-methylase RsmD